MKFPCLSNKTSLRATWALMDPGYLVLWIRRVTSVLPLVLTYTSLGEASVVQRRARLAFLRPPKYLIKTIDHRKFFFRKLGEVPSYGSGSPTTPRNSIVSCCAREGASFHVGGWVRPSECFLSRAQSCSLLSSFPLPCFSGLSVRVEHNVTRFLFSFFFSRHGLFRAFFHPFPSIVPVRRTIYDATPLMENLIINFKRLPLDDRYFKFH